MKKYITILLSMAWGINFSQSTLITPGVNEPNIVATSSQNGGIVPPRMTSLQIQQIVAPVAGTLVYDTTINCLRMYDGTKWECQSKSDDTFAVTGYNQYCTGDDQGNDIIAKGEFVYVAGQFTGSISFTTFPTTTFVSLGETDGFVAKFNRSGNCIWAKHIRNTGKAEAMALAVDASENVYVGGNYVGNLFFGSSSMTGLGQRDIFLSSYDNSGNIRWIRSVGGVASDSLTSIAVDGLGYLYATGGFKGTVDFEGLGEISYTSAGDYDFFLTKYNGTTGQNVGTKIAGSVEFDIGNDIFIDNTNLVYVCGNSLSANISLDGYSSILSAGTFAVKLTSIFSILNFWPVSQYFSNNVFADSQNNSYFQSSIFLAGNLGVFTITAPTTTKYGILNNLLWDFRTASTKPTSPNGIIIPKIKNGFGSDNYGNTYVSGFLSFSFLFGLYPSNVDLSNKNIKKESSNGDTDIYIIKLDPNGDIQKVYTQGGNLADGSTALSINEYGEIYTTGFFSTTQNFGSINVVNNGGKDFFVMKLVE